MLCVCWQKLFKLYWLASNCVHVLKSRKLTSATSMPESWAKNKLSKKTSCHVFCRLYWDRDMWALCDLCKLPVASCLLKHWLQFWGPEEWCHIQCSNLKDGYGNIDRCKGFWKKECFFFLSETGNSSLERVFQVERWHCHILDGLFSSGAPGWWQWLHRLMPKETLRWMNWIGFCEMKQRLHRESSTWWIWWITKNQ